MDRYNLGAVRRALYASAVFTLLSVPSVAQVVERGRTFADLTATHPCDTGLTNRIARVTDCDAADDIGDGEGAFQCWAICDGSAPWVAQAIGGGGGGGLPGANQVTESMLKVVNACTDEYVLTCETTTGDFEWQAPATGTIGGTLTATDDLLVCTDGTGGSTIGACTVGNLDNLRLDGNTISSTDTNGNIVLAPNGTGQITVPNGSETKPAIALAESATKGISFSQNGQGNFAWVDSNQVRLFIGSQETRTQADNFYGWTSSTSEGGGATTNDTALGRAAAGIVSVNDGTASGGAALHLNPLASPPRTCDATAEGDIYSDTSHALCWCDASAWQKLSGAGTCA